MRDGRPLVHLHSGQNQGWNCRDRFIAVLSGAQSGKTCLGPWWLGREIKDRGPGNYLLIAPTFRLLDKQAIPSLNRALNTYLHLGEIVGGSSGEFRLSRDGHERLWPGTPFEVTRIVFGYAENPNSLASITAKAAWLDECGQAEFKQESHEEIQSRLAIHEGRILYTSTPYTFNWFKTEVHDRARRNQRAVAENLPPNPADFGYAVVSYESRMNPVFPKGEWERQRRVLPDWKFRMRYCGLFTRPAGAVYDCWDQENMVMPTFTPDPSWKRHVGVDFGAPNFAAVFIAEQPGPELPGPSKQVNGQPLRLPSTYYVYAEYRPQEARSAIAHVKAMREIEPGPITTCVGGAKSEKQWRLDLGTAGFPVSEPDQPEVEVGIDRTYAVIKADRLRVCDNCPRLIDEFGGYSRPVDEQGNVLEGLEDKEIWHGMDSIRYIVSYLERKSIGLYLGVF